MIASGAVQVVNLGSLTEAQRAEVEGAEEHPFGVDDGLEWRPKDIHVGLQRADGRLVASAGLVQTDVEVARVDRFPVVGLGGVIVNHEHRGRGLSRLLIETALARAATLGPDRMMLFCGDHRVSLYDGFGFALVQAPVEVGQPDGTKSMPQRTMWRPLHAGVGWPDGPVLVHGLPF